MNDRELFKIWAPSDARWTDWARPVPFIGMDSHTMFGVAQINIPAHLSYVDGLEKNCAIFIDMPDHRAINDGLALAKIGWRPIPLYNGCDAQAGVRSLLDNRDVKDGLILGAAELNKLTIAPDAPPVFLLDTTRANTFKMKVSVFDNSWDIYPQDVPSAQYFLKNGIDKMIVRTDKILKDLKNILYTFQKSGIKIYLSDGYEKSKEISIKKPLRI